MGQNDLTADLFLLAEPEEARGRKAKKGEGLTLLSRKWVGPGPPEKKTPVVSGGVTKSKLRKGKKEGKLQKRRNLPSISAVMPVIRETSLKSLKERRPKKKRKKKKLNNNRRNRL